MIALSPYFEIAPIISAAALPALKQAAVWGTGSALAARAAAGKAKTRKQKAMTRKQMATAGLIGGASGAAGHLVGLGREAYKLKED